MILNSKTDVFQRSIHCKVSTVSKILKQLLKKLFLHNSTIETISGIKKINFIYTQFLAYLPLLLHIIFYYFANPIFRSNFSKSFVSSVTLKSYPKPKYPYHWGFCSFLPFTDCFSPDILDKMAF